MASIYITIPAKISKIDYDSVLINYEWGKKAIEEVFPESSIIERFHFTKGEKNYLDCNINEFKRYAHKQNCQKIHFTLSSVLTDKSNVLIDQISLIFDNNGHVTLSTMQEDSIIKLEEILEKTRDRDEDKNIQSQTIIHHSTVNNTTNIGDNAIITDSQVSNTYSSSPASVEKKEEAKKDSFWKPIAQNLISRITYWILGFGLVFILAYFGFTGIK